MHILFMVFRFAPHSGGAVIVATEIANNLAKLGHKVTVLTPDLPQSGLKYEPEMDSKVKVIRVDTPSKTKIFRLNPTLFLVTFEIKL